jgi:hypothetical protein
MYSNKIGLMEPPDLNSIKILYITCRLEQNAEAEHDGEGSGLHVG